jgi:hypothetical protein
MIYMQFVKRLQIIYLILPIILIIFILKPLSVSAQNDCTHRYTPALSTDSYYVNANFNTYGVSGNYYVKVENRDSSDCPTSNFAITVDIPNGWRFTENPIQQLTLIPGQTSGFKIFIEPPHDVAKGNYEILAHARNITTNFSNDLKLWFNVEETWIRPTPINTITPTLTPTRLPTRKPTQKTLPTATPIPVITKIVISPTQKVTPPPINVTEKIGQESNWIEKFWEKILHIFQSFF